MHFKTYYLSLSQAERDAFAERVGTSTGYCNQLVYGDKHIELGLADAIVAASGGKIELAELPLTERAKHQDTVRRAWKGADRRKQNARAD